MTRIFRLTPKAAQDLRNIGRFTLRTWGRERRDIYLRALDRRFAWLAEFPERGRHRSDIKDGYYSYVQDAHVIFCLIRDGGIDIIGIPRRRMDVASYFSG
jgi:toxin ParE1/3/4